MTAIFVWRAFRNFAIVDFEENVEEMVGTTREAAAVATESSGDEMVTRPRTRPVTPGGILAKINSAPSSSMLKIYLAPTGVWQKII